MKQKAPEEKEKNYLLNSKNPGPGLLKGTKKHSAEFLVEKDSFHDKSERDKSHACIFGSWGKTYWLVIASSMHLEVS